MDRLPSLSRIGLSVRPRTGKLAVAAAKNADTAALFLRTGAPRAATPLGGHPMTGLAPINLNRWVQENRHLAAKCFVTPLRHTGVRIKQRVEAAADMLA